MFHLFSVAGFWTILAACLIFASGFGSFLLWRVIALNSVLAQYEDSIEEQFRNPTAQAVVCGIYSFSGNAHQRRIARRAASRANSLASA